MNTGFIKKAENYIEKYGLLSLGDKVVLGVSGGADSVALLVTMNELKVKYDLKLFVVHVNHGLRLEAVSEADYVKSLCKSMEIPFFLIEENVEKLAKDLSMGTEEAGRKLRYDSFKTVAEEVSADKIAVAHNKNDRAETMLFNLFRGTGPKGLASISPVRDNIIRPLLCMERREIEDFLNKREIKYCIDGSNLTDDYTRNKIRNRILPTVNELISEEAVSHMATTADQLSELNAFAQRICDEAFTKSAKVTDNAVVFNKKLFLGNDIYIQKLLVKKAFDELVPHNKDITHIHIGDVLNISRKDGTKSVNLPYGIEAVSSYEELSLLRNRDTKQIRDKSKETDTKNVKADNRGSDTGNGCFAKKRERELTIVPGGDVSYFAGYTVKTELVECSEDFDYGQNQYTKCFDYDKINQALVLRFRRAQDEITVNKSGGTKKLKDYMINEKIPKTIRDLIPVLCIGNRVLWVVGYRMGEFAKISESTERVLRITVSKEEI